MEIMAIVQSDDDIDKKISAEDMQWMKTAAKYVKECITPDSRYKLRKFIEDDMLNRIRLDKTLFHIPKSHGSYVDARTGRRTIRGANAKERPVSSSDQGCDNEIAIQGQTTKSRKCPPRCIVCCAVSDSKNKASKITKTTIYCSICMVSLCTKRIGNRKTTCFERFHQIPNLLDLQEHRDLLTS